MPKSKWWTSLQTVFLEAGCEGFFLIFLELQVVNLYSIKGIVFSANQMQPLQVIICKQKCIITAVAINSHMFCEYLITWFNTLNLHIRYCF